MTVKILVVDDELHLNAVKGAIAEFLALDEFGGYRGGGDCHSGAK